jgi:hypothetical protein
MNDQATPRNASKCWNKWLAFCSCKFLLQMTKLVVFFLKDFGEVPPYIAASLLSSSHPDIEDTQYSNIRTHKIDASARWLVASPMRRGCEHDDCFVDFTMLSLQVLFLSWWVIVLALPTFELQRWTIIEDQGSKAGMISAWRMRGEIPRWGRFHPSHEKWFRRLFCHPSGLLGVRTNYCCLKIYRLC